jgi:hypothetical protein
VTESCRFDPTLTTGLVGVILSPLVLKTGTVTVRFVFPVMPFRVALISVVPAATDVATPLLELIVAIEVADELQVAVVMSADVPSE